MYFDYLNSMNANKLVLFNKPSGGIYALESVRSLVLDTP